MPPAKQMYLIKTESDGFVRTVMATSDRVAAQLAALKWKIPHGERVGVKLRGAAEDWAWFRVQE